MRGGFLKKIGYALKKKLSKNGLLTIFRYTWHALAFFLVILAIVFTLFRALTPWVKQYRSQIQQQLSVWVGQDVEIQDIGTSWYWFTPVLKLNQVTIGAARDPILHFNQLMVGINLLGSLLRGHIHPGVLYVDDVHLNIYQQDDIWRIDGLNLTDEAQSEEKTPSHKTLVALLLAQDKVIIKHVSAELNLQDGTHISLQNVHFKSDHHAQNYRLYSKASIGGKPDIQMTMVANMTLDGQDLHQLSGQAYLSLSRTDLTATQKIFPHAPIQIKHGTGSIEAWLDFMHGHLATAQATVNLKDVVMQEPSRAQPRKIATATANMAWQRLSQGWRTSIDHFDIQFDGITWPENAFLLEYREVSEDYHAYIKALPLQQLLQTELPWPKSMQPILALKPKGHLQDTELSWQQDQIKDFLTKFSQLSWHSKASIPGLTGLSGAVYWQPTEGRLEVNGEQSLFSMQKPLVPIRLDTLSASLDWKYLSQGWRISLDDLVISRPNLVLSAAGAIDDPWGAAAHLRLQMDFSAKDAQMWLPYIPSKGLKPKLDAWLKHDIPRIARASGRVRIVGPLAEFPFDNNQNGEFSIQTHVNGVDLKIDDDWPINSDMDADIRVNGRHLVADVHQATLNKLMVHQVSISIPGIGLGKEVFLLHGLVNAPGEKIKSYVFSSPLQKRFDRWKALTVSELLGLDLHLEVPLYPESDHVYAKGSLNFKQNPVAVEVGDNSAEFVGVTGRLDFNEYGLISGGLDGTLNNYPFTMRVQPLLGPKAGTELRLDGEVDVNYLRHVIHHPVFSVMQGRCIVNGLWTVYPDAPETDKLLLNSSLMGLAVHLPPPFGKSWSTLTPMSIKVAFSPQRRMNFDIKYGKKVTGNFSMQQTPQQNWVTTGDFHFGEGSIGRTNASGLRITGSLPEVNVDAWQSIWNKWPKGDNSASLLASLKEVHLTIGKVTLPTVTYPDVKFTAQKMTPQEWRFNLRQKDIAGDFGYNWAKNSLSAHIEHLNAEILQSTSSSKWKPKIANIPNLDVTVDSLNYRGKEMGKINFNAITQPGHWILKAGKLETPEYAVGFKGDWVEDNEKSASSMEAELHMSHLANALIRWHITPVVDAHYGSMTFTGKWPSAFYDGALKKLNAKMTLILRDGHISHLDRDTEKKLGLGKLLSILSLQTIPRRLKLDFSDLSQKGYTFDLFKGTFNIHQGVMSTDDSYIDGPVAFGRMSGDLDLVHQLYDLDLRIFPYITASLPIVASIVGTPVAGVAVWAVSSLANKGMQKISGYTYKISGPWLNPVVQQISIDKSAH